MTTFSDLHPRSAIGTFATKEQTAPAVTLAWPERPQFGSMTPMERVIWLDKNGPTACREDIENIARDGAIYVVRVVAGSKYARALLTLEELSGLQNHPDEAVRANYVTNNDLISDDDLIDIIANPTETGFVRAAAQSNYMARPSLSTHLANIAAEAGLEGAMGAVFQVVRNRETLSDHDVRKLTADDADGMYNAWIAPSIDSMENDLIERDRSAPEADFDVEAHIQRISDEAGFGGIMPALLDVVIDREAVPDSALHTLTASDIAEMYEVHIEPAISDLIDTAQK